MYGIDQDIAAQARIIKDKYEAEVANKINTEGLSTGAATTILT